MVLTAKYPMYADVGDLVLVGDTGQLALVLGVSGDHFFYFARLLMQGFTDSPVVEFREPHISTVLRHKLHVVCKAQHAGQDTPKVG